MTDTFKTRRHTGKTQRISINFTTCIYMKFMNKFKLVALAIILAACSSNEGDTNQISKSGERSPALALRDSAMRIAHRSSGEADLEKSLKILDEAMAMDPGNKSIFYSKMQVLSKSGSEDGIFEMLLRLDTMVFKDPYSNLQLGVAYELRGNLAKADAKYHDAINVYAAILDTMQNTPLVSRNNNVLNLAVAERLVQENPNKLQDVITEDEKQYLGDLINQIQNRDREVLLEKNRKKTK